MHSNTSSPPPLPVLQMFISDLEQLSDMGGRVTLRNAAAYAESILGIVSDHVRSLPSTLRALADVRSAIEHADDEEDDSGTAVFREKVATLRATLEREHPDAIRVEGRAD